MYDHILIKGAREHNLKNINISIPRDKITVITGPSGSGKSSLAIDTIYAEGNRRYMESLSPYARQFIEQMQKPDFDYIEGLSPSIAIDQKTVVRNIRSTVGTITEIYNYMRVLYAKIGKPYCYQCGQRIETQERADIISSVLRLPPNTKIQVMIPIAIQRKGEYKKELQRMRKEGFIRARINGEVVPITDDISLKRHKRHNIEIIVDRLKINHMIQKNIEQSIELALRYSDSIIINVVDENRDILFSKTLACHRCGISYPQIEPGLFSFNSQKGACSKCKGTGIEIQEIDEDEMSFTDYTDYQACLSCGGSRLKKEALGVKIEGKDIAQFSAMNVEEAYRFLSGLNLTDTESMIARRILKDVRERLRFIIDVGLGYLTLDRSSITLSGGEAQRIRLAAQMGASITGALYILDEPSIGLHPKDCSRLIDSLKKIRENGNTVIVVEHDEETIKNADYIIDMGPGAGEKGGWVTACGSLNDIINNKNSLTGSYLRGDLTIHVPLQRRRPSGFISIYGARAFNLKSVDVKIPLGVLCCVTGLSGSGKSSLVFEVLYKTLKNLKKNVKVQHTNIDRLEGYEQVENVIVVDQRPLGRHSRSNPATYTGVFSLIRELFAGLPEARMRGFDASRFSFNISGGRCEACKGEGSKKITMSFLPNAYVICDVCKGKRYNKETLEILYKGKSIADVLNMTITEAMSFFKAIPRLHSRLSLLSEIGLGYLRLGQQSSTLSGGEAQRLMISKELSKKSTGHTLYILDEPTVGLHLSDISVFLNMIHGLVENGNSVIIIEHDLNVIKSSDYIIDLGPEGGDNGGFVMATGTPEEVAQNPYSYTAQYLKRVMPSRHN
ncbi:MAG: excinuclease ABC subunit UvrA [Thermodesulfovibrionales bacterium]|nr:excinuclease ABC subunit UvrA [Thermodesulfovibrionales bacterium]